MLRPFEVTLDQLQANIDEYIDATYADLGSSTLVLPKSPAFVEYARFQSAYEVLKRATTSFREFRPDTVWNALLADSLVLVVLRTITGLTPPEWAALVSSESVTVSQNAARDLDQRARRDPSFITRLDPKRNALTLARLRALIEAACEHITAGAIQVPPTEIHRLDKVDTAEGLASLQHVADFHVPYAALLYERYLGRPFASHRDSVLELVGDPLESAIEALLLRAHVTYRKTKRAERVPGFDQAPDFIVPDEYAPSVVIEAKVANDDGTARDKFTRIIHLAEMSRRRLARGESSFQVVACIDGAGFRVRRADMAKLLTELNGKVFTMRTLDSLVPYTDLSRFATEP